MTVMDGVVPGGVGGRLTNTLLSIDQQWKINKGRAEARSPGPEGDSLISRARAKLMAVGSKIRHVPSNVYGCMSTNRYRMCSIHIQA